MIILLIFFLACRLDRLLDRLERLEKIQRNYAIEKVRGYFLTLAERKRYLRKLWEKANEEEIRRLSILQPNDSNFPNEVSKLLAQASIERPIIPKIVINSDMVDNQTSYGDSTSLSPYPASPGSGSYDNAPLSPNFHWSTTTAASPYNETAGIPSPSIRYDGPLTPSSPASYMASQDGSSVSHDSEADMLLDNFNTCVWSGGSFLSLLQMQNLSPSPCSNRSPLQTCFGMRRMSHNRTVNYLL